MITPRTAQLLYVAAVILSDEITGAMGDLDVWGFPPFVKKLPPAALAQFRTAFLTLATPTVSNPTRRQTPRRWPCT
ncbi:hypothetical protein AB0J90_26225 [Micromonospora sp. NPDC049523]|uniref:hypothetical protein n=1 Tax=Micromonospora sp. NPDC049523 TaxID=3155921 RepID=UPI003444D92E